MSDTSPPAANSVPPAKPLIASTTAQATGATIVAAAFVVWPIATKLLHHQAVTQEEAVNGFAAAGVLLGALGALWGRWKAVHPISGLLRVRTS